MNEIAEPIERILWFIYRVFFALLPSGFLLFVLSFLLRYYYPVIIDDIANLSTLMGQEKWFILLAITFCFSLIIDSLSSFFFLLIGFKGFETEIIKKDEVLEKLFEINNSKIGGIIKQRQKGVGTAIFNYSLLFGDSKNKSNLNQIYFRISTEFFISAVAVSIIICQFAVPFFLQKNFPCSTNLLLILFVGNFLLTYLYVPFATRCLIRWKHEIEAGVLQKIIRWCVMVVPFFVFSMFFFIKLPILQWVFLTDAFIIWICPVLFLRTFFEYLHVGYLTSLSLSGSSFNALSSADGEKEG